METFVLRPEFEVPSPREFQNIRTGFETGDVQSRPRFSRSRRTWNLRWNHATHAERGEIEQFHERHRASANSFNWTPTLPVGPPGRAMVITSVTSGALSQRTYYVVHTWVTANGETTESIRQTLIVPINKVLKVTVPEFPPNVTAAKVYVNTVSGDEELQATISTSGGSWTEPDSGLVGAANPPTTNTATENLIVHFLDDKITPVWKTPTTHGIEFTIEELFS